MSENRSCYEILLNYHCNAGCLFCSQGSFDKSLNAPFELISKEIYLAKKKGFARLGFSGGEPTADKNLIKAVKLAKKIGFKFIRIQTNGIKLSDKKYCRELFDAGLVFCKFSFTTDDKILHDMLVNVPGAWDRAMEGVRNLKKLKVRLGNNIVVNRYNYNRLKDIVEFFMNEGISNFVVIYPIYTGSMFKNKVNLGVSLPEASPYMKEAVEFMDSCGMSGEILFLNVPPCFLPGWENNAIGISAFNTVVSDPAGVALDLDESANSNKIKGAVCAKCGLKDKCFGVDREYINIFGWKGFSPAKKNKKQEKTENESAYFTDNEKCMLEILKKGKEFKTQDILTKSKKLPICQDCVDGNAVLNAGERLVKRGIVKRILVNGVYMWSLRKSK